MKRFKSLVAPIAAACVSALALAACGKPAAPANESDTVPLPAPGSAQPGAASAATPPAAAAPAQPGGPAEPAQKRDDEFATSGAHVTQVEWLPNLNVKVFSNAGGDPAINGLMTYLAFPPESPDESWAVFQVGDFEEWKLTEQAPGKVVLEVRVSRIDPSSGNPVTEDKRLIVNFAGEGAARTVTVTPAR